MKLINSLMVVPLIVLNLTGCGVTKIEAAPSFCSTARAIYVSADDQLTDETARQMLSHNEIGKRICGWGQ